MPVGWMAALRRGTRILYLRCGEESPGSMEARCRITSGGGDPRESATESKPPAFASGLRRGRPASLSHRSSASCEGGVRVKGCGKSAPRAWQQGRHGKPHREQDRIGMVRAHARVRFQTRPSGLVARGAQQCASQMNGHRALGRTEPGLQANWRLRPWPVRGKPRAGLPVSGPATETAGTEWNSHRPSDLAPREEPGHRSGRADVGRCARPDLLCFSPR
jgi:hypothetical protein